jgi:hypothetical protein
MTYDDLNKTERAQAEFLEPWIDRVQAFVDENITEGVAMPAKAVYEKFTAQRPDDTFLCEKDFVASFRVNVKIGRIKGIEGVRRWGYRRIGSGPITNGHTNGKAEPSAPEPVTKTVIYLTDTHRLIDLDKYQWALQKRSGESWQNRGYYSCLGDALRSAAVKMLNDEIKASTETIMEVKDLGRLVRNAEDRLNQKYTEAWEQASKPSN